MDDNLVVIIRISIGLTMFAFGLSQLKDPKEWLVYIPKFIEKRINEIISVTFMRTHAMVNVVLGVLYAIGIWEVAVAWLTFAWWSFILPFVLLHNWKIGMRDLAIVTTTLAVALALS